MSKFKLIAQIITLVGAISWILLSVLRSNNIPTLDEGYIITPWIFFIGLQLLAINVFVVAIKSTKKNAVGILIGVIVTFWGFCGIFSMMLVQVMSTTLRSSEGFEFISSYIESDSTIVEKIGEVYAYGIFVDGTFNDSKFDATFSVYAEKSNPNVHFSGHKEGTVWVIDNLWGI